MDEQLWDCADNGLFEQASHLISEGVDVNWRHPQMGKTSLHCASRNGHLKIVRALLQSKAEVDAQDAFGTTALHYAAWMGFGEVAEILLSYKASAKVQDNDGCTPLMLACFWGKQSCVSHLLRCGALLDTKDKRGETAADKALEKGNMDVLNILVRYNASRALRRGEVVLWFGIWWEIVTERIGSFFARSEDEDEMKADPFDRGGDGAGSSLGGVLGRLKLDDSVSLKTLLVVFNLALFLTILGLRGVGWNVGDIEVPLRPK